MNLEKWMNHYRSNPEYEETTYRGLPCFEKEIINGSAPRKSCFPVPLMECFEITPYIFKLGHYVMEGSTFTLFYFTEDITIDFLSDNQLYSLNLRVFHSDAHHHIKATVSTTVSSIPEDVQHFLKELYTSMYEFLLQYSPHRLEIVTTKYEMEIPAWLESEEIT